MTQTATVFHIRSDEVADGDHLRDFIKDFPDQVAKWKRDDVIFGETIDSDGNLVLTGVAWDPDAIDACCDEFDSNGPRTCEIPLQVTNRYRNAFAYFAPVMAFSIEHAVLFALHVAPSDGGLETVIGNPIYQQAAYYSVWRTNSATTADFVAIHLDEYNAVDSFHGSFDSEDSTNVVNWSEKLNPLVQNRLSTVCVAVVCAFDRELTVDELNRLCLTRFQYHFKRGWYHSNQLFSEPPPAIRTTNDVSIYGVDNTPFLYVVECPVNLVCALRSVYRGIRCKGRVYGELFRQYPLLDRLPPGLLIGGDGWMLSASIRQPYLSDAIITLCLILYPLPRYVLIEIIEWVSRISRLVPRHRLDSLTAAAYESIKRIRRLRDGPSRNTRSRKPASE